LSGYSQSDVSKMLDLSVGQIRSYTRAGVLKPRRGDRGEFRYTFHDLVLLRAAKGLRAAEIPPRKIRAALTRLRDQLPSGRPLTAVHISAAGDTIVVRDGRAVWDPESGQSFFDFDDAAPVEKEAPAAFEVAELATKVAPFVRRRAERAFGGERELTAEEWYELAFELEATDPEQARDAYRRTLDVDPYHAEAHVNLGRLLHEAGDPDSAEEHYRLALAARPDDPTALFNLGVSLEDLGNREQAERAYLAAIEADTSFADAHYNLARLYEARGDKTAALRHYTLYRRATRG
jgi:tetratricopeptide (TPR) repeat protein